LDNTYHSLKCYLYLGRGEVLRYKIKGLEAVVKGFTAINYITGVAAFGGVTGV
jgi:hypothetical protein